MNIESKPQGQNTLEVDEKINKIVKEVALKLFKEKKMLPDWGVVEIEGGGTEVDGRKYETAADYMKVHEKEKKELEIIEKNLKHIFELIKRKKVVVEGKEIDFQERILSSINPADELRDAYEKERVRV